MEGMEPDGSSSEMRSTRVMGKKMVGRPMRSASNWLIWLTKWSNEFRSTPRKVTPLGLISSKRPQIFSRGECRLTITMELGSMSLVVLCLLQLTARGQKLATIRDRRFGDVTSPWPVPPSAEASRSPWLSSRFCSLCGFVGAVEPLQRVVQVRIGTQCKREPSFARRIAVEAGVAFGSLRKGRRHRIKFKKDGGHGTEAAGVGESGEDFLPAIKGAESEHALGDHGGPGEQLEFEQRRPAPRLFRDRQEFGSWAGRFLANRLGFRGPHRLSTPA